MNARIAPHCPPDAEHCITCSDAANVMRLAAFDKATSIGVCVDDAGTRTDVFLDLIANPRIGDTLLVHAGTALLRLDQPDAGVA